MKEIPLTQGKVALVDDNDYENLCQWNWFAHKRNGIWYAARFNGRKQIHMHRIILDVPDDVLVDHKDRDGLNNQRSNLRPATLHQNAFNKTKPAGCSSKYKGVYRLPNGKFKVTIQVDEKSIHGGYHFDEFSAAKAYDLLAKTHFGEFAVLNFP